MWSEILTQERGAGSGGTGSGPGNLRGSWAGMEPGTVRFKPLRTRRRRKEGKVGCRNLYW